MLRPTTLLRSLGNRGAIANVEAVLEHRRREAWIVEALLRRLDQDAPSAPAEAPAARTRVA